MIFVFVGAVVSAIAMKISPVLPLRLTSSKSAFEGSFFALRKEVFLWKWSNDTAAIA